MIGCRRSSSLRSTVPLVSQLDCLASTETCNADTRFGIHSCRRKRGRTRSRSGNGVSPHSSDFSKSELSRFGIILRDCDPDICWGQSGGPPKQQRHPSGRMIHLNSHERKALLISRSQLVEMRVRIDNRLDGEGPAAISPCDITILSDVMANNLRSVLRIDITLNHDFDMFHMIGKYIGKIPDRFDRHAESCR
jgi:hypothetical protein